MNNISSFLLTDIFICVNSQRGLRLQPQSLNARSNHVWLDTDSHIIEMIFVIFINQIKFARGFVTFNCKYYFIIETVKGALK